MALLQSSFIKFNLNYEIVIIPQLISDFVHNNFKLLIGFSNYLSNRNHFFPHSLFFQYKNYT